MLHVCIVAVLIHIGTLMNKNRCHETCQNPSNGMQQFNAFNWNNETQWTVSMNIQTRLALHYTSCTRVVNLILETQEH